MSQKNLPYIFLLLLILVLIFLGGVKYGQKVEETNKTIKYYLSLTPTKAAPTPTIPVNTQPTFYTVESCGISFLYPAELKKRVNSRGALFDEYKSDNSYTTVITTSCYDPNTPDLKTPPTSASFLSAGSDGYTDISSEAATLKEKKINNFKIYKKKDQITMKIVHPTGYYVMVEFPDTMLKVVDRTFAFITPAPTKKITIIPTLKPTATSILSP